MKELEDKFTPQVEGEEKEPAAELHEAARADLGNVVKEEAFTENAEAEEAVIEKAIEEKVMKEEAFTEGSEMAENIVKGRYCPWNPEKRSVPPAGKRKSIRC